MTMSSFLVTNLLLNVMIISLILAKIYFGTPRYDAYLAMQQAATKNVKHTACGLPRYTAIIVISKINVSEICILLYKQEYNGLRERGTC